MLSPIAVGRMSLAAATRRAVDRHPFLVAALRAGVVNYTAAARYLDVDGEPEAIATALGRYAEELSAYETSERTATVRMQSGVGVIDGEEDPDGTSDRGLLTIGGVTLGSSTGSNTAIIVTGSVDSTALAAAIEALAIDDVDPNAAAVADETMVLVVDRRDSASALRTIEETLDRIPEW